MRMVAPGLRNLQASRWLYFRLLLNEYILESAIGLQDTNDTFLANLQKDGTYSVVPRVTGGEITRTA